MAPPPPMYDRRSRDAGASDGGLRGNMPSAASQNLEERVEQLMEWGAGLLDPEKICAGFAGYSCGIDRRGSPMCWGHADIGASHVPNDAPTNAVQISCGNEHACVLTDDGEIVCWGSNIVGQTDVPIELYYKEVAAGGGHTCAITGDDDVVCWGAGEPDDMNGDEKWHFGQSIVPRDGKYRGVTVNQATSCAIAIDSGRIACWGSGADLDCDTPRNYDCGQLSVPEGAFDQISLGLGHGCGIRENGSTVCWGRGLTEEPCEPGAAFEARYDCGQSIVPTDVDAPFVRVRAGTVHTCGVTSDYELRCWGWNGSGQTNVPAGLFSQVSSSGDIHTCGINVSSAVQCWGGRGVGETAVPSGFPD